MNISNISQKSSSTGQRPASPHSPAFPTLHNRRMSAAFRRTSTESLLVPAINEQELKSLMEREFRVNQLSFKFQDKGVVWLKFAENELMYRKSETADFEVYDDWRNIVVVNTGRLIGK